MGVPYSSDKDGIFIHNVSETHQSIKAVQFFFFDMPKETLNNWLKEVDSSLKPFS